MDTEQNRLEELNRQGETLFAAGDHDAAIGCFQQALRLRDDDPDALNNLGVVYMQRGDLARGLRYFMRGLEADPYHRELVRNTCQVLDGMGCHEDAQTLRAAHAAKTEPAAAPVSAAPPPTFCARLAPLADEPLVSIIMPTRDRPHFVGDALASIVAQGYQNWEAIVVNDGGVDIESIVENADPRRRIRHLRHRCPLSQVVARNTALRVACGDIVCYLDDDDLFLDDHIETVVARLQATNAAFVYTDCTIAREVCNDSGRKVLFKDRVYDHDEYSRERLLRSNYIPINTWAHRYECVAEFGGFDESLTALEDWELLLRWSQHFDFEHVRRTTVEVRERVDRQDNVSRNRRREFIEIHRELYQRYPTAPDSNLQRGRDAVLSGLEREFQAGALAQVDDDQDLYRRWQARHALSAAGGQLLAERRLRATTAPRLTLLTVVGGGQVEALTATFESLSAQLYRDWRWCVCSPEAQPAALCDRRIEWRVGDGASDPARLIDAAVAASDGDWFAVLDAGVRLPIESLCVFADYIDAHPAWQLVYADEDRMDAHGERSEPRFKPDINPDLLRSMPYIGRFCFVRRDAWRAVGGIPRFDGAEVYDLALRVLDHAGAGAVGHVAEVLCHTGVDRPFVDEAAWEPGRAALRAHLARNDTQADVKPGLLPGSYWIDYRHPPEDRPLVSIIVPTRNALEFLRPCVDSVLDKTGYADYELLIVDNDSDDPQTLRYLEEVAARDQRVRVLRYREPFNFAAIHNWVVPQARGDYLLLLNNDTQVIQDSWLERMLNHGRRSEVGVVGARLVFLDQRLQHAGVILGLQDVADHVHIGLDMRQPGYLGRAQCVQNYSAVTAACLLIRKSVYEKVGGMDETHLAVLFNDVDLCLKVGEAGYRVVWTPYATLIHHGSRSVGRQRSDREIERARAEAKTTWLRWRARIAHDPAYNRQLSIHDQHCRPEVQMDVSWDPNFRDRPRLMGFPFNEWGTGEYRVRAPLRALSQAAWLQHALMPLHDERCLPTLCDLDRAEPDVLLLQNMLHEAHLQFIDMCRRHSSAFRVFGQDDLLAALPPKNPYRQTVYRDITKRLRRALSLCDRLIVTTAPLAEAFRNMIDDIAIVPNRIEEAIWGGLSSRRGIGVRPRIGWAGAQQHQGDLELLAEVVKQTHREADWIFFGMCPDALRPYCAEYHEGVRINDYPAKLASLDLDLAVAPLERNRFNEAKSNLRLLEYGILGWPVVCSDILPYEDAPVCRVTNTSRAWIEAIRERIHDPDASAREGDCLRQWVRDHWILERNLEAWYRALLPGDLLAQWLPLVAADPSRDRRASA